MIGYLCKYTPIELFLGFGETPELIDPQPAAGQEADVHPNLCSFAKSAYSHCAQNKIGQIVATNCCDSIKRIYDALGEKTSFRAMLNLPRVQTPGAVRLYAAELKGLIRAYETAAGKAFNKDSFKKAITAAPASKAPTEDHIAVLGARMPSRLLETAQECCSLPILDYTCTGQTRGFGPMPDTDGLDALLEWYAGELLAQIPCMRMQDVSQRSAFASNPHLKGILYHTIKFCDYYGFEYADLKKISALPILKLETDYTDAGEGQLKTRLQAFYESLGILTEPETRQATTPKRITMQSNHVKYYAGIDSGSTSTDAVLIDSGRSILGYSIVPTGGRSIDGARSALEDVLAKCGIEKERVSGIIATGYGRNAVEMGDPVTEITCHAKGAFFLNPRVRTIVDIGGQDSKIIKLDGNGNILDFTMNDKCAAGTGRFLEMMAHTLAMGLEEFAAMGLNWTEDIKISSMCSVFAESEVISLIAQNKAKPDIVHGINQAITTRIYAMIARLNCSPVYMMTGGVAKNKGVVMELSKKLGEEIAIGKEPQICGALGAALIASER